MKPYEIWARDDRVTEAVIRLLKRNRAWYRCVRVAPMGYSYFHIFCTHEQWVEISMFLSVLEMREEIEWI